MDEPKTMKQLHTIRERNYERMKKMSVKDRIAAIHKEAEPLKKRLLNKIQKKESPTPTR
jgi:argininosuccinate lyase